MRKARPTKYKGIQMRSRLEARFAAYLDLIGADWRYEPEAFADERGQYLPDFEIVRDGSPRQFVEVKPTASLALQDFNRVRPIFSSVPSAEIRLTWPHQDKEWRSIVVNRMGIALGLRDLVNAGVESLAISGTNLELLVVGALAEVS
jgi:hypothetical protein